VAVSLSGVASGIDTATIVSQLMAIEGQAKTRLQLRESAIGGRETGLKDVQAKLTALKTAATALKAPALWEETQDVASTDATRVLGTRTGSVAPGVYDVRVQSLAVKAQQTFTPAPQAGVTQLTLTRGSDPAIPIDIPANATATDIASAINANASSYAVAKVSSGKLVLTAKASGQAGFEVSGPAVTEDSRRAGADAAFTVDGVAKTSPTNTPTDAIPGLRLTLKVPTSDPVVLTVGDEGTNVAAVKEKVKGFVDAYNAVVTTIQAKTTEKRVAGATTSFDAAKGQLFGDRALSGILSSLRTEVASVFAGNPAAMDQLADLGVASATGADGRMGKLVFTEAKLTAALETDPAAVQRLLGGFSGAPGIADAITTVLDRHVDTTDGTIAGRLKTATSETSALKTQMTELDRRLESKEKRLKAQFAAMEKALGLAQSQQSWLSGQIAGLSSSS
jgi:flagellar hook-associated protein 2